MNDIFEFHGYEVRTMTINGEPYFVGKDVAEVLGYSDTNQAIRKHVDDEDKLTRQFDWSGQNRNMTVINESGVYNLIFGAAKQSANTKIKEKANRFKRWVTSEVLPTIRKHGMFATDELLDNPDFAIATLQKLKEEREAKKLLEHKNEVLQLELEEARKQTDYLDLILQTKDMLTTTQIAQDYGMSANKFNQILKQVGIQRKVNGQWILYTKYQGKGYIASRTFDYVGKDNKVHSKITTVWTQLGRRFIYEKLKDNDIYPLIEQAELF